MFLCYNGHAAILLLVLTRILVFASFEDDENKMETVSKAIISSMQDLSMKRTHLIIRDSETSCAKEIAAVSAAIGTREMWALQMLDASSKLQSGILKGHTKDLGNFDECIEVNGQYNDTIVRGKHCGVSFNGFSSAVCVPSSCNETQVIEIIGGIIQNMPLINESGFKISGVSCARVRNEDFSVGEIITMFFFSVVGALIIVCTICEFIKRTRPTGVSNFVNILATFSLYTNGIAVLSTKVNPRMIPAIQGMRFLSICWIILAHRYGSILIRPTVNILDAAKWSNSWSVVYIQTATFAVDTFFVISGFLTSYLYFKSKQSGKRSNFLMMYLHRYLRLTPSLAVLMLFVAVLLHRVANGPLWNTLLNLLVEPCRKNWWVSLLYVQNYVRVDEMCLSQSWYLAVDMQLFWISPIILYPLHRWPKWGRGILYLLLVGSVFTPGVVLLVNGHSLNSNNLDIPTYNRACAYLVGMLLGFDTVNKKRRLTQTNVAINWVVTCILMLLCALATRRLYNTTFEFNVVLVTTFVILSRPFWSVAIAWIIYACTFGYGGAVAWFLSLPIFLPLSRLSYGIYLVHTVIQLIKTCTAQTPGRFSDLAMLNDFWSDLVLSIVVAFIFSLFFESPMIVLEKILTNRGHKQSPVTEPAKDMEDGIDNQEMTEI